MALFNVLFDIAARTTKFEASMTRVERQFNSVAKIAKTVGTVAGGAFAISSIVQFGREAIELGDNMTTLSQRMGVTVETLSRLQYVAEQNNTTFDSVRGAMDRLAKGLSLAEDGSGKARQALADLGVEADYLTRLPINEQLNVIADAFGRVQTPADQVRVATQLFGDAGTELIPILQRGSAGIREMGDEAERTGAILKTSTASALSDLDSSSKALAGSIRNVRAEFTALIATPLGSFLETEARGISRVRKALGIGRTPLDDLRKRLEEINELMGHTFRTNESKNQLNDEAIRISALISQYEEAAARESDLIRKFAVLESQTAAARGQTLLAEAVQRESAALKIKQKSVADQLDVVVSAQRIEQTAMQKFYADLEDDTRTSVERQVAAFETLKSKLNVLFRDGMIDGKTYGERISEAVDDTLQPIEVSSKRISQVVEKTTTEMSEFHRRAFQNIHDSLADLLFNPFERGIKGMLSGFVDVLRRMVAEAASAEILKSLFGDSKGFGAVLGKIPVIGDLFKAAGGPVVGGRSYVVGERGPELFTPGASGAITPNHAMVSAGPPSLTVAPVYNISGLGLSFEQVQLLMRRNNEDLVRNLVDPRSRRA